MLCMFSQDIFMNRLKYAMASQSSTTPNPKP